MTTSSFGSPLPRFDFTSAPFLGRRAAAAAPRAGSASYMVVATVAALAAYALVDQSTSHTSRRHAPNYLQSVAAAKNITAETATTVPSSAQAKNKPFYSYVPAV